MNFKEKYNSLIDIVNKVLDEYIIEKDSPEKNIYTAMRYSLTAGGKRLRPILALATCEMLGGDIKDVLPCACAIEMIHTYSLIHDDLPAMDNDDFRRGRLTNHKVYGEATAILAGDALLNCAFETMLSETLAAGSKLEAKIKAMAVIAKSAGASGMIGGQIVDLESEGKEIPVHILEYMHRCKTGALIKAPVVAGAILSGASEEELSCLEQFGAKIGLAFQVKDDIMDIEGSLETMGKKTGSDIANKKSTFVSIYGLETSKKMLNTIIDEAEADITKFGEKSWFLKELAQYIVQREN